MLRTVITPETKKISLDLPEDIIGRQVEVIAFTLDDTINEEKTLTHFASEKSLAKDWLTEKEDKAWQNL